MNDIITKNFMALWAIKCNTTRLVLLVLRARPTRRGRGMLVECVSLQAFHDHQGLTFQWLKSRWYQRHSGALLHLQG